MACSKLSVRNLSLTLGLLWALGVFFVGTCNRFFPGYGSAFLEVLASIYPAYSGLVAMRHVLMATVIAFIDGAIVGILIAVIYNAFGGHSCDKES